jgi:protein TonB
MPPPSEVRISPEQAEKLLIHKADPVGKCKGMPARVTATVVIGIQISVLGEVLHPIIISGPRMMRQPALDAVRQYKYKPYVFNGKPVKADTTVSVHFEHFPCG